MGSLLIIVVKLHSYKDSDVRNLHKFEYLNDYFMRECIKYSFKYSNLCKFLTSLSL